MHLPRAWPIWNGLLAMLLAGKAAQAINVDINSEQSIKDAASTVTWGMMTYYHGNESGQIPGAFPDKWWEGAALFLALLNYWHFTGDATYNNELSVGMEWQSGDDGDYMPSNFSSYLGNDDQMFWGVAAMTAAEFKLPDVPDKFSWLSLAQGVFNTQVKRWDTTTCDGGLRWQIWPMQAGYTMKNTISNAGLFQLAARLARWTNDDKYAQWAQKVWDWCMSKGLLNNETWFVADSTSIGDGCSSLGRDQWSYNYAALFTGAAYMYAYTNGSAKAQWLTAVQGLLNHTFETFFPPQYGGNVMEEVACEPNESCNRNEILFKGLTTSWMALVATLVPSTYDMIVPKLQTSAQAAAKTCTGNNNNSCGVRWYTWEWDGWTGMEDQISVSNVLSVSLLNYTKDSAPVTSTTGGNSTSNPNAGSHDPSGSIHKPMKITAGDRAGAGILTAVFISSWIALMIWVLMG
ncbi:hypothetical protein MAP00_000044 [Monascus purpureus]|nr:hypothetical protein MAP00_000044 [Monascus purpureus]